MKLKRDFGEREDGGGNRYARTLSSRYRCSIPERRCRKRRQREDPARLLPANYPGPSHYVRMRSPLDPSRRPSSARLAFSATAFFTARPVESYVPGYPHRRRRAGQAASRCFSAHRAFFSPFPSLPICLPLPPRPPRLTLLALYLYFRPARRERLARNPPQNKRAGLAARRSRAVAQRAAYPSVYF